MIAFKRFALIADVFPPLRSSGAIQLRDLALEMVRQGVLVTVIIPSSDIKKSYILEDFNGVQVLRLKSPRTRDMSYARRTVNEFCMPFFMLLNFWSSPCSDVRWDGVVWYSPSIFLGPVAVALKKSSGSKAYLIIRDIFPEWAVDMGLLRRGLLYRFFKVIERFQYSVADTIGVQTMSSVAYFDTWADRRGRRVEVLQNWLSDSHSTGCSISIDSSPLSGRIIFVYAGNMGIAQGMNIIIDLAEKFNSRDDIGFLFVGRGSCAENLKIITRERGLENVVFHDEIDPSEIRGLYEQCHVGIVALDPRHKTHNIPGKFLSYMQSGLPVLASINVGNDLVDIIEAENVGRVCTDYSVDVLYELAIELVDELVTDGGTFERCRALYSKLFSSEAAVKQIIDALKD